MILDPSVFDYGSQAAAVRAIYEDWHNPKLNMAGRTRYSYKLALEALFERRDSITCMGATDAVCYVWWQVLIDGAEPELRIKEPKLSGHVRLQSRRRAGWWCVTRHLLLQSLIENDGEWYVLFPDEVDRSSIHHPDIDTIMLKNGLQPGYWYLSRIVLGSYGGGGGFYEDDYEECVEDSRIIHSEIEVDASVVYLPVTIGRRNKARGMEVVE